MTKGLMVLLFPVFVISTVYAQNPGDALSPKKDQGVPGLTAGQPQAARSDVPEEPTIDVCEGKIEGTVCETTTPEGITNGVCQHTPDKHFACIPNGITQTLPPAEQK